MNPLIFIPSPRDIPEFNEATSKLNYDKFWVKYHRPEIYAYIEAQSFFLSHTEYSHLVILPDDLLVTKDDLDKLLKHVRQNNIHIVSGFCNIDTTDLKDFANICIKPVHAIREKRQYTWMHFSEFSKFATQNKDPRGLIKVQFSGFPLMVISRTVLEKVNFRNDSKCGLERHGCCLDVTFCFDAINEGFDIFVDPAIRLLHLKIADGRYQNMVREKEKEPYVKLVTSPLLPPLS